MGNNTFVKWHRSQRRRLDCRNQCCNRGSQHSWRYIRHGIKKLSGQYEMGFLLSRNMSTRRRWEEEIIFCLFKFVHARWSCWRGNLVTRSHAFNQKARWFRSPRRLHQLPIHPRASYSIAHVHSNACTKSGVDGIPERDHACEESGNSQLLKSAAYICQWNPASAFETPKTSRRGRDVCCNEQLAHDRSSNDHWWILSALRLRFLQSE